MLDIILLTLGLIGLTIGSVTDLQRREVPDYINFGLIALAGGIRLTYAVISGDWWQLLFAVIGAIVCFGIACIFFYSGQWGGGDAKMLIALGALFATYTPVIFSPLYTLPAFLFGFLPSQVIQSILDYNLMFLFYLIINILIAGAVYGIFWSFILAIKNREAWWIEVKKQIATRKMKIMGGLTLSCIVLLIIFALTIEEVLVRNLFLWLCAIAFAGFFLQLAVTAVEKACMIGPMKVGDLTEGEWVVKNVYAKGRYICGPKDLGISEHQIKLLKKNKIKSVIVKIGVPFIPAFLLGFLLTVIWGNVFSFVLV